MKKLALSLAVLFAVGLVSCGDNKKEEVKDTTDSVEAVCNDEDKTCDSAACDSSVEKVEVVDSTVTVE